MSRNYTPSGLSSFRLPFTRLDAFLSQSLDSPDPTVTLTPPWSLVRRRLFPAALDAMTDYDSDVDSDVCKMLPPPPPYSLSPAPLRSSSTSTPAGLNITNINIPNASPRVFYPPSEKVLDDDDDDDDEGLSALLARLQFIPEEPFTPSTVAADSPCAEGVIIDCDGIDSKDSARTGVEAEYEFSFPSSPRADRVGDSQEVPARGPFADAAQSIKEASGFRLAGLEDARTLRDVVACVLVALREEDMDSPEGDGNVNGDACGDRSSEDASAEDATKDNPNPNSSAQPSESESASFPFTLTHSAFASYAMLSNPGNAPTRADRIESLAWVLMYVVLRYARHNAVIEAGAPPPVPPLSPVSPPLRSQLHALPQNANAHTNKSKPKPNPTHKPKSKNKPNLPSLLTLLFSPSAPFESAAFGPGFPKLALFLTGRPLPRDFAVFSSGWGGGGGGEVMGALAEAVWALLALFEERYRFEERRFRARARSRPAPAPGVREKEREREQEEGEEWATKRHVERMEGMRERMEEILETCLWEWEEGGWFEGEGEGREGGGVLVDGLMG